MNRILRPGGHFFISEPCADGTPLRDALRPARRALRRFRTAIVTEKSDSQEAAISADGLRSALDEQGLRYDMRFLSHLPELRAVLPPLMYLYLMKMVSYPWKSRRGDLVFVYGRRPNAPPSPR
jgi:hypothetical protein